MLLIAATIAGFACSAPRHHDGDAIMCAGSHRSDRLYGIDAPEMPGACRPGRRCTPGDPYAARDMLARLTNGRSVVCNQVDSDVYGRRIVRCSADGEDLSCAMIASGLAVARYGRLDCRTQPPVSKPRIVGNYARAPAPEPAELPLPERNPPASAHENHTRQKGSETSPGANRYYAPATGENTATNEAPGWNTMAIGVAVWLILVNSAAWAGFAIDKKRSIAGLARRVQRIPERRLLLLAGIGGSIGAIAAQQLLRHKTRKLPFASQLLWIAGCQAGVVIGVIAYLAH
jgi:uncharacterized membrane protein YsdA (DUF1294 family)